MPTGGTWNVASVINPVPNTTLHWKLISDLSPTSSYNTLHGRVVLSEANARLSSLVENRHKQVEI